MIHDEYTARALLKATEEKCGERDAFRYSDARGEEHCISFRRLREESDALSAKLLSMGLCRGQIALFGENSFEWLLGFFAITGSGNTAVPTDRNFSSDEALRLFHKTDCTAVICSDDYEDMAQAFEVSGITVIRMHELCGLISEGERLLLGGEGKRLLSENRPQADDPAAIFFTSGTNGDYKAAVLSHRNLVSDAASTLEAGEGFLKPDYNGMVILPLNHVFSMLGVLTFVKYGCCDYILGSLRKLPLALRKVRPQVLFAVPMLMDDLLAQVRKQGMGREAFGGELQTVFCGGAPVRAECVDGYHELGIELMPGYGITECSPVISFCSEQDRPEHCVGVPLSCCETKIAEDGEILVRGENVFSGYYNDPAATEAVFRDGWFLTGDIGYTDEKGRLYITGRKKNLIILSNGENVAAEELEHRISQLPYVREVLVYEENNTIVAEAFLDGSTEENMETRFFDDIQKLNKTLPIYKNIGKTVVRATEFPKTGSMKIKRERKPV